MGRKILFVTTDQQRYDALGCNGGTVARTPVGDGLAAAGVNYRRAVNQNVVCMPARSTMITGQYPRTHGVYANGMPLPADVPSVAAHLHEHGYRTALLGEAHFEPAFDFDGRWPENRLARDGLTGPHRGFEHLELAMHGPMPLWHYGAWLRSQPGDHQRDFYPLFDGPGLNGAGGGYDGTEGELYDLSSDPYQWENRWGDPLLGSWRDDLSDDLIDDLWAAQPPSRPHKLALEAPV